MSLTGIDIRHATPEDADALAEFGARRFAETFGPDNTPADMESYLAGAFSPRTQGAEIADPLGLFLIADAGGSIAGYARLQWADAPECVDARAPIEVVRLYADVPWMGRGLGSSLMEACLVEACRLGRDVVWLDVWERNPRAIAFYTKWGFAKVGEQQFILGDDVQNDWVMSRPVS